MLLQRRCRPKPGERRGRPGGFRPRDDGCGVCDGDGLAGVLDILASHKLVATFAVPAAMGKIYPQAVETVLKRGHEIAAEGLFHEDVSQLSLEDERARVRAATAILSEFIGSRPAGWYDLPRRNDKFAVGSISPHTTKLLVEEGYTYMGNVRRTMPRTIASPISPQRVQSSPCRITIISMISFSCCIRARDRD